MLCDMLDDRKSKPCAALCTAAAFINSVEALENSWYAFLRYAKPRVGYGHDGFDIGLIVVFANKNYSLTFHDLCGIITIIQFINGR